MLSQLRLDTRYLSTSAFFAGDDFVRLCPVELLEKSADLSGLQIPPDGKQILTGELWKIHFRVVREVFTVTPKFEDNEKRLLTIFGTYNPETITALYVQVVYLTFEPLWNLAKETFVPVWSFNEVFVLNKFGYKIDCKRFDSKIFKIGDPVGLWLNMAVFEIFEYVEPLWNDQSSRHSL